MRERINSNMKDAMRAKDAPRLSTLRLINAAIKDRDIAVRGEGNETGVSDGEILAIMGKMIKQRQDSARAYDEAGRLDSAEKERNEIKVIEEFLPRQLNEQEVNAAVKSAVAKVGAASLRDMGRVMAELKAKYAGQMDFGKAGGAVKALLG
ncbi:MAG: GatB/YqeY domain-containing protein [Alphaproteobacteria bacterium]|nr:GatB/YqeY domain-containing protein [Alphaproteobacteria bacterium]